LINKYLGIAPKGDLLLIKKLCERLHGKSFLHINSTGKGGGVAEILQQMVPLLRDLGIDAQWKVMEADISFFDITKKIHNSLQGRHEDITQEMWDYYYEVNQSNAEKIDLNADAVLIHDPQPAPMIEFKNQRSRSKKNIWIWRCHIDISNPIEEVWAEIKKYVIRYHATIISVAKFSKLLPIDEFIIPPAIDPLSEKNRELSQEEINEVVERFNIQRDKPIILQVSRFDKFKDPIGVINAYKIVKRYNDCRLILAGSPADDDPEGDIVLRQVLDFAGDDPDIYVLLLHPNSHKEINALQRIADVVLQKSLREGFGLTVSEAMWKEKPVIGGAVGGIPMQIVHGVTGFIVYSVEGAAFRIRQLLNNPEMTRRMGQRAKEYIRNNFLITRQIRDYLSIWYIIENKGKSIMEL
jgi:trehalose synthase